MELVILTLDNVIVKMVWKIKQQINVTDVKNISLTLQKKVVSKCFSTTFYNVKKKFHV